MDLDNVNNEPTESASSLDIEPTLLQQFNCMSMSDREDLIAQLQKVIGPDLSYSNAAFFLDMNNWNLQGAVCSYFDVEQSTKLPHMALVSNPNACENESIEPNTSFKKIWLIHNPGVEPWPSGCYVQCADAANPFKGKHTPVECLAPLMFASLTIHMLSPSAPGVYQSTYRLTTPSGSYFGDPLWVIVTVEEQGTVELTDILSQSHLNDPEFLSNNPPPPQTNPFRRADDEMS